VVTAFSTALTAAALFGFSCSGNLVFLCCFAVPLGLGAGAIDTAINNYVALHYSATHMSFLHCFYGVGVSISPYLMSLGIGGGNWRRVMVLKHCPYWSWLKCLRFVQHGRFLFFPAVSNILVAFGGVRF